LSHPVRPESFGRGRHPSRLVPRHPDPGAPAEGARPGSERRPAPTGRYTRSVPVCRPMSRGSAREPAARAEDWRSPPPKM